MADGCKAFNLTGVDNNDMVVGEETATLAANAPALLSGNGEYGFTATGVEVTATPQSLVNGILTASYADGAMAPKAMCSKPRQKALPFIRCRRTASSASLLSRHTFRCRRLRA